MTIFKCEYCAYETDRKNTLMRHLNKKNKCYEKKSVITSRELLDSIIIKKQNEPNCEIIEQQNEPNCEINVADLSNNCSNESIFGLEQQKEPNCVTIEQQNEQNCVTIEQQKEDNLTEKKEPNCEIPEQQKEDNLTEKKEPKNKTKKVQFTSETKYKKTLRNYNPQRKRYFKFSNYENEKHEYQKLYKRVNKYLINNSLGQLRDNIDLLELRAFYNDFKNNIDSEYDKLKIH